MARVVAHLGRPETPQETADRKAESSRNYRNSQNVRNLVAALIFTVALVAVMVWVVPRGSVDRKVDTNVAEIAALIERQTGSPILVPAVSEKWGINSTPRLTGNAPQMWQIIYTPDQNQGFVRVTQALGGDAAWAGREMVGGDLGDTITLDGVQWQQYTFKDQSKSRNISYALGTQAGKDHILIYGSGNPTLMQGVASGLTAQVNKLKEVSGDATHTG